MPLWQPGQSNELISFRFALTFGVAAAAAIAALTLWFVFAGDSVRTALLFFAAACAAAGQLGASLYAARVLQMTAQIHAESAGARAEKEAQLEKQLLEDAAARFGERWTDASMFHLRKECRALIENRTDPKKILDLVNGNENTAVNVGNILNFLEELSLSVLKGRCSEEIAKSLFCGIVINIWHATEPWVRQQRTNRGRPQLWMELETLYGRWR